MPHPLCSRLGAKVGHEDGRGFAAPGLLRELLEMQLIRRRAAAKTQLGGQEIVIEDIDECAADDEILLDLTLIRPWNDAPHATMF